MYEQGNNWFAVSIEKYEPIQSPQRSLAYYERLVQIQPKATYCCFEYIKFVTSPQFEYQLPLNHCCAYIERLQTLLGSQSFVLFHVRGKILKRKIMFKEAIEMYQKSIKLNKLFWPNHQDLASIYLQTKQFSYALEVFRTYCGYKSHKIRGVIAEYDFKVHMYHLSEIMIDQLAREDALSFQFIPFMVQSFGYRGRPEMMINYANQHEGQQNFVPICYFLAQTFSRIGDSINAVKYLKLIRSNCKEHYSVANSIKIARQSMKNGDTAQSSRIIEEIEMIWQDLNAEYLTKFVLLLFQSQRHERVIKIYESKLKHHVEGLANESRMDLLYALAMSSQKVDIKLAKAFKKQFDLFLCKKCGFMTAHMYLQATQFYKRRKSTKKANYCYYFLMKELKDSVFSGFPWQKKTYAKQLELLKK